MRLVRKSSGNRLAIEELGLVLQSSTALIWDIENCTSFVIDEVLLENQWTWERRVENEVQRGVEQRVKLVSKVSTSAKPIVLPSTV